MQDEKKKAGRERMKKRKKRESEREEEKTKELGGFTRDVELGR